MKLVVSLLLLVLFTFAVAERHSDSLAGNFEKSHLSFGEPYSLEDPPFPEPSINGHGTMASHNFNRGDSYKPNAYAVWCRMSDHSNVWCRMSGHSSVKPTSYQPLRLQFSSGVHTIDGAKTRRGTASKVHSVDRSNIYEPDQHPDWCRMAGYANDAIPWGNNPFYWGVPTSYT